jgi:hypothetical protein
MAITSFIGKSPFGGFGIPPRELGVAVKEGADAIGGGAVIEYASDNLPIANTPPFVAQVTDQVVDYLGGPGGAGVGEMIATPLPGSVLTSGAAPAASGGMGKVVAGAGIGFVAGGPIGAAIGAALGFLLK